MNNDEMITAKAAAKILDISQSGVLKAIGRGAIEARKFGEKNWAVFKSSVLEYRDKRGHAPGRPRK